MRQSMKKVHLLFAGGAATAVLAACTAQPAGGEGGDGESVTLTYAFFAPAASFPAVQMEEWATRLDEMTETDVEVDLFPGGTLLDTGDIYDGVSSGVADVGLDSPAYDTTRFPFSSAINLPMGFENSQVASATFFDLIEEFQPSEFDEYEILTAFTTEPAHLQTTEPVTSADDLANMELRVSGAHVPNLELLGAAPVGMSMAEVAEALQTGVVSGYVSSREVLQDFSLAEMVSYVTDYPFGVSNSFVAVMDAERYETLPADVQDAIQELREEMMTFASSYHDEENVGPALDWAEQQHGVETVTLDEGEQEVWDANAETLIENWIESNSGADFDPQEVVDRMRELVEEHAAELGS